jgi:hypothetical protein
MIGVASFVHSIALLAYPKAFRVHFGRELSDVFRRRLEHSRALGTVTAAGLAGRFRAGLCCRPCRV